MFICLEFYCGFSLHVFRTRSGKPQSTNTDGAGGYEGQSLTGNNEDSTLKDQLQRINEINENQL